VKLTGAQALIRSLEACDVEVVFGLPGGAILPAYDPLRESSVRHILVRHEQGAGHAAEGYAWATGKVGVCMATSGPGATNLVTALCDAYMDSVPLVAITGQVPSWAIGSRERSPRRSTSPPPAGPARSWSTCPRTSSRPAASGPGRPPPTCPATGR
jgi:thiamine pyrophosphate-dependent acetolactate synthase large subunit-like protein